MKWEKKTVFISSTFNDMHAERDYLVKEVFPELTEWCEERKIRLTDIDLRWGVTEADSESSKTIETCLRHIDKSRPFFLCFLGQRRGWVPDFEKDINDKTKERYTTIDDLDGRSATEMEIEHALIKPIHMFLKKDYDYPSTKHSLFFFRDDSYLDDLTVQRYIQMILKKLKRILSWLMRSWKKPKIKSETEKTVKIKNLTVMSLR